MGFGFALGDFVGRIQEVGIFPGLYVVRKLQRFYDWVSPCILPRRWEEQSEANAVPGKEAGVTRISQRGGVFGHFGGLSHAHIFVSV